MRSFCHEYQFSFILNVDIITITTVTNISHLHPLCKRDREELRNGPLEGPLSRRDHETKIQSAGGTIAQTVAKFVYFEFHTKRRTTLQPCTEHPLFPKLLGTFVN